MRWILKLNPPLSVKIFPKIKEVLKPNVSAETKRIKCSKKLNDNYKM